MKCHTPEYQFSSYHPAVPVKFLVFLSIQQPFCVCTLGKMSSGCGGFLCLLCYPFGHHVFHWSLV